MITYSILLTMQQNMMETLSWPQAVLSSGIKSQSKQTETPFPCKAHFLCYSSGEQSWGKVGMARFVILV